MKKIISYILLFCCAVTMVSAQTSLSFYHLGNATFQNSFQNPAFIPEGKVSVGLPVLSGIHLNVNNKFSYSEFIVKNKTEKQMDLQLLLNNLQKNNMASLSAAFSLFHVAITSSSNVSLSFFANERIEGNLLYPRSVIQTVAEGNESTAGEHIKVSKFRAGVTYFREIGVGYAARIARLNMTFGLHAKYLNGFYNVSTPLNFNGEFTTDPEIYTLYLDAKNAVIRTSGIDILRRDTGDIGSHLVSNANQGFALDAGVHWEVDRYNAFSASLTDLGFIAWKENIRNYELKNTTIPGYSGIDLKKPDQLEDQVRDSLINRLKRTENADPYIYMLDPIALVSWTYRTSIGRDLIGTLGTRYILGQFKWMGGVGYRHTLGRTFTGTFNVIKLPQQFLNLGMALVVKGGPAQFYLAVDQIINYDATKFKAMDARLGINLVFGGRDKSDFGATKRSEKEKIGAQSFLGAKVKAKSKNGIYTIIPKQKRRNPKQYQRKSDEQKQPEYPNNPGNY